MKEHIWLSYSDYRYTVVFRIALLGKANKLWYRHPVGKGRYKYKL